MRSAPALLALAFLSSAPGCTVELSVAVRIEAPDGERHLEVEVDEAITEEELRLGLAEYDGLADERGLLLRFPVEDEICIQNAGVSFAIDAVFVDESGVVTAVESDIAAFDGALRCHLNTNDVLEVGAGVAAEVAIGDQLRIDRS